MDHGSSQFIIVGRIEELERCIIMNKKINLWLNFFPDSFIERNTEETQGHSYSYSYIF